MIIFGFDLHALRHELEAVERTETRERRRQAPGAEVRALTRADGLPSSPLREPDAEKRRLTPGATLPPGPP